MLSALITTILFLVVADYLLFGFFPCRVGQWPSVEKVVDEDGGILFEFKIDTASSNVDDDLCWRFNHYRVHLFRGVVTKKSILIRNTLKTYLVRVRMEDVASYTVERGLFGKRVILNLDIAGKNRYLKFRPQDMQHCRKILSSIGIPASE
jgi:hypothetical protein